VGKFLKRLGAVVVTAAIASAIIYLSMIPAAQKQMGGRRAMMKNASVPVTAAQTRVADMPIFLEGVGTAKARKTVTVRPQVDGRILSINFKEGQEVQQGEVLAKIDPSTYQAQLDQAAAKKALDEAQLDNARKDLDRYTQLGGNIIAQKTIDTQRALVDQLTAQIKVDDAAIASAKAFLSYTTIVAPITGRTGIRLVDEGNLVRATDAGIVVITELRPISVLFTLPQQQLGRVNAAMAKGAPSTEALDTGGKTVLDTGALQVVDNQVDQSTGTVRLKAEFANANLQLWPGQFVNVRLHVDTLQQVVIIPTPAVQRGPNGTFAYVIQEENSVALRPITVSYQTETEAVISEGITSADRVVTTGFSRLRDGATISLPEQEEAPQKISPATTSSGDRGARMRAACAEDMKRLCADTERSRKAIRACLETHASQLSEACRDAAAEAVARGKRVRGESSSTE
jgi:multidrug efflux system membrane fusion protein